MKRIITASLYQKGWIVLQTEYHSGWIFSVVGCLGARVCFLRMQPRCLNLNRGKDGNGAAFFFCALCASEKSSQNRLTALWAVGRFLPRWASSPAWQRRLDVIKVYTLSAVGESVWNGLCCCQKHGLLLCISILHGKSQRRTRNTDDHSCIFIFWCHLLRLQRFSRCCWGFFFSSLVFFPVIAKGWGGLIFN